jgi:hypothetical protein
VSARWYCSIKCEKCDAEFPPTPYPLGTSHVGYGHHLESIRAVAARRGWTSWKVGNSVRDFCPDCTRARSRP